MPSPATVLSAEAVAALRRRQRGPPKAPCVDWIPTHKPHETTASADAAAGTVELPATEPLLVVAAALASTIPGCPTPPTLSDAYEAAFTLSWAAYSAAEAAGVSLVLQLVVSSYEPPSLETLAALGADDPALQRLPLWGVLFQVRMTDGRTFL